MKRLETVALRRLFAAILTKRREANGKGREQEGSLGEGVPAAAQWFPDGDGVLLYGSSTQPVTATRTYPNLANQDLNHLPKSITEGGRTLTLQDVQWQTDNTYNADDYEIGDRFTAVCTYGGSKTVSYVTGYTTTANYSGEVYRTGVTVIRYTVIFTGTPMEPVAEEQSQSGGLNWLMVALPVLAALGAGTEGTYFFMKRKERKMYEELAESSNAADSRRGDDGDPGTGGGV